MHKEHVAEYVAGFAAGAAGRARLPFVGETFGGQITNLPVAGVANRAIEVEERTVHGTPLTELAKEEIWKYEHDPLDLWEQIVACADADTPPTGADVFRFKFHGLFHVAPAQDAFMLRVRVPGNVMSATQLRGLADMAAEWGGGYGDVTTRGNIQLREFPPRAVAGVLMRLQDLGLSSRGAGADNVRNITATPTSGIDPDEVYDVRPLARALQFYILNTRELFGLPRKFNVSFDSGGRVSVVADTNDIAFVATRVPPGGPIAAGIYFRVLLAGITGHQQFATDAGLALEPHECVAVAAAMLRVYAANGDRTNRKKARLKYLIEKWGTERFLSETEKRLAFPLRRCAEAACEPRRPIERHGHIGVHAQKQPGLHYVGAAIPVGRMRADQMRKLADIADRYGSGDLRPTVWQNLILTDIPDHHVDSVCAELAALGFGAQRASFAAGMVACTGNTGCKYSATNTKGQATLLAAYLDARLQLDQPLNIHLTGCPHSCAQHFIGDIGLLGTTVTVDSVPVEGYHVYVGGGSDDTRGLGRELFRSVPFSELAPVLERVLEIYQQRRSSDQSFSAFVRGHPIEKLRNLFAA